MNSHIRNVFAPLIAATLLFALMVFLLKPNTHLEPTRSSQVKGATIQPYGGNESVMRTETARHPVANAGDEPIIEEAPPSESPRVACTSEGVALNFSDSTYDTFCAMGGSGSELRDDGRWVFSFRNLDGKSVVITSTADEHIESIELDGGRYGCRASACQNASISPADAQGARVIRFAGTSLSGPLPNGSEGAVTLNGTFMLRGDSG